MAENEDWGMVALEANACAKPVVATNAGGLAESQSQEVTALLISPDAASVGEASLAWQPILNWPERWARMVWNRASNTTGLPL